MCVKGWRTNVIYLLYILLLQCTINKKHISSILYKLKSLKKKQHQAQAKHLRHIRNLSSHLHGPGHIPVLAL